MDLVAARANLHARRRDHPPRRPRCRPLPSLPEGRWRRRRAPATSPPAPRRRGAALTHSSLAPTAGQWRIAQQVVALFFFVVMVVGLAVILPINLSGSEHGIHGFSRSTAVHIARNSPWLWVLVLFTAFVSLAAYAVMYWCARCPHTPGCLRLAASTGHRARGAGLPRRRERPSRRTCRRRSTRCRSATFRGNCLTSACCAISFRSCSTSRWARDAAPATRGLWLC